MGLYRIFLKKGLNFRAKLGRIGYRLMFLSQTTIKKHNEFKHF